MSKGITKKQLLAEKIEQTIETTDDLQNILRETADKYAALQTEDNSTRGFLEFLRRSNQELGGDPYREYLITQVADIENNCKRLQEMWSKGRQSSFESAVQSLDLFLGDYKKAQEAKLESLVGKSQHNEAEID